MPRKKKQDNGATETNNAPRPKPKSATAKKPPAKKATGRRKAATAATEPSDEQIRIRAYFISERRRRLDIHGDASSDWIEAKRQLLSESGPR